MKGKHLTLGSLFDGIGGFPLAALLSEITPVWAAEVDPACVAVTKLHFPNMIHYGDVTEIDGAKIPPVDIITFGSPCQDLSIAGVRAGLAGERSGLFLHAIRIVYEMRKATNGKYPTFIVWENVDGAFSSRNGHDFQTVLSEITKTNIPMPASGRWANAGVVRSEWICVAWRVFDAKYWGVPQRRKRIYLVGSFGNRSAEEILFKPDRVQGYLAPIGTARKGASGGFEKSSTFGYKIFDARGNGDGIIAPTVTGDHNNRVTDYTAIVFRKQTVGAFKAENGAKAGGIGFSKNTSPTLTAAQSGTNQTPCIIYSIDRAAYNQGKNAKFDFEISDKGINSTITARGPSAVAYSAIQEFKDDWIVRRLTPLENERLQGYPDGWTVLPKIETMSEADYNLFLRAYLLDKRIKGQTVKKTPKLDQIVRWYNRLDSDSTRYRQLGNSLAIPCALRVIGGIAEYIKKGV